MVPKLQGKVLENCADAVLAFAERKTEDDDFLLQF
jgi:hypothetical protein